MVTNVIDRESQERFKKAGIVYVILFKIYPGVRFQP